VGGGRAVWEHLLNTVGGAAGERAFRTMLGVPTSLGDEARRELVHLGWRANDRLLFVHPGAGGRGKRWPVMGFAEVLERLAALPRLVVVIHQGPADAEAVAGLPESLIARAIVLREPPLPLLAGVLSHAAAYLGNDSGISHLAAALGVRGVALFGAEQVAWRSWWGRWRSSAPRRAEARRRLREEVCSWSLFLVASIIPARVWIRAVRELEARECFLLEVGLSLDGQVEPEVHVLHFNYLRAPCTPVGPLPLRRQIAGVVPMSEQHRIKQLRTDRDGGQGTIPEAIRKYARSGSRPGPQRGRVRS